jgi:hypothetical protein
MLSFTWSWVSLISLRFRNLIELCDERRTLIIVLESLAAIWPPNDASEAMLTRGLGRMVWNYTPDAKIYRIAAWRFSTYFVCFDIM